MEHAIYPVELEVRERGRRIRGRFPYNATAVLADRGNVRKERITPGAFSYAIEDPVREINLLRGHSFDEPLARKGNGSLVLDDRADALEFEATLPEAMPSYMRDAVTMIEAGLLTGISPGFRVPPKETVPDAETIETEAETGVGIRVLNALVLYELSVVSRAAYPSTEVDLRAFNPERIPRRRRLWL